MLRIALVASISVALLLGATFSNAQLVSVQFFETEYDQGDACIFINPVFCLYAPFDPGDALYSCSYAGWGGTFPTLLTFSDPLPPCSRVVQLVMLVWALPACSAISNGQLSFSLNGQPDFTTVNLIGLFPVCSCFDPCFPWINGSGLYGSGMPGYNYGGTNTLTVTHTGADICVGWVELYIYYYVDDWDSDGACDAVDNCPYIYNPSQTDWDGDGLGDVCDNCPYDANLGQEDSDRTYDGSAIAPDGIGDACDNCYDHPLYGTDITYYAAGPDIYNPAQSDADWDGWGNECDNCQDFANPEQLDSDIDGWGDACDNCPFYYNPNQYDFPFNADIANVGYDTTVCFGDMIYLETLGIPDCGDPDVRPWIAWFTVDPQGVWNQVADKIDHYSFEATQDVTIIMAIYCGTYQCFDYDYVYIHVDECDCDDAIAMIEPPDNIEVQAGGTVFLRALGHGCMALNPASFRWYEGTTHPDNLLRGSPQDTITIRPLKTAYYYLVVICGTDSACADTDMVYIRVTGSLDIPAEFAEGFKIVGNNPFSDQLILEVAITEPSPTILTAYDLNGRYISTIAANSNMEAGAHRITWNGLDDNGSPVPSGVYLIKLDNKDKSKAVRVMLIR